MDPTSTLLRIQVRQYTSWCRLDQARSGPMSSSPRRFGQIQPYLQEKQKATLEPHRFMAFFLLMQGRNVHSPGPPSYSLLYCMYSVLPYRTLLALLHQVGSCPPTSAGRLHPHCICQACIRRRADAASVLAGVAREWRNLDYMSRDER